MSFIAASTDTQTQVRSLRIVTRLVLVLARCERTIPISPVPWSVTMLGDEAEMLHFVHALSVFHLSERWRQWFVKYELLLFKVRMSALVARQQQMLLQMNNIQVQEVCIVEIGLHGHDLSTCSIMLVGVRNLLDLNSRAHRARLWNGCFDFCR